MPSAVPISFICSCPTVTRRSPTSIPQTTISRTRSFLNSPFRLHSSHPSSRIIRAKPSIQSTSWRYVPSACNRPPSSHVSDASQNGTPKEDVNGVSRTLLGKLLVEVLSLVVGALLLLVVVLWRASQVVSAGMWRAMVWISNLRLLGKWAVARLTTMVATTSVWKAAGMMFTGGVKKATAHGHVVYEREQGGDLDVDGVDVGSVVSVAGEEGVGTAEKRRLVLVRHAKTVWDREGEVVDHERVLSEKGREEAKVVGAALVGKGWVPHRILCSNAVRTVQTLGLLNVPNREGQGETLRIESLYYAVTGEEMAEAVDDALGEAGFADGTTVMIVCHNPGCEELVEQLTGRRAEMGTGCAALLEFNGDHEVTEDLRLAPRNQEWSLVEVLRPAVLAVAQGSYLE
eukprot:GFKZ01005958.1.p1 GENE.GFKZ01005958.1~~GFKZ01005958.1.p1  ORF type:complete len:401 (+),score=43.49 GFKZ01005958.1:214-1416(+)